MTTTYHLQVYDAAVAALQAFPALADGNVKTMRSTNRPMPEGVSQQLRVFLDPTLPQSLVGGNAPVDWITRIRVECMTRDVLGPTPVKAFDAASTLAAQVHQRLLQDTALQALVSEVSPAGMQWVEDEADTGLMACQCIFTVQHRTPFTNLTV